MLRVLSEKYTEEELRKKLEKKLDSARFIHSEGVAMTAVSMVMRFGDLESFEDGGEELLSKAYTAGLLHDCAKCLEDEATDRYIERYGVKISDFEKENPFLIHAKLGAVLAREKYGVTDEEILSAIRFHTTGRAGMTFLEKIIFSADFIEPYRKPLIVMPKIRHILFEDLDRGVLMILEQTGRHLEKKGQKIDPVSIEAVEFYRKEI